MVGNERDAESKDGESESGQLAEKFGISIFKAREIIDKCGDDTTCRDSLARAAKAELPAAGGPAGDS
jgi:hypothetical protein